MLKEAVLAVAITEEAILAVAITAVAITAVDITEEDITEEDITEVDITTMAGVRESSLADTSGSPTITVTPIITRTVTAITTPMGMRIPLTPIRMTNLKRILNRNSLLTGITVGIRKVITRMSQVVRAGGRRWLRLHLRREGRVWKDEVAPEASIVLSHGDDRRLRNNAYGSYCEGHARAGKAL